MGYIGVFRVQGLGCAWTPKVCKILALLAAIMGLGRLCYILLWV